MRTIDFSPLYRSVVGFDRLADLLDSAQAETATGYPPYNIERTGDNEYRIEIAVAGFRPEERQLSALDACVGTVLILFVMVIIPSLSLLLSAMS